MNLRQFAVAGLVLVASTPAAGGPREDALDALARCAAMSDNSSRLACYDGAAAALKAALSEPPTPVAQMPPPVATAARGPQERQRVFGFDGGVFDEGESLTPEDRANGVTQPAVDSDQLDSINSEMVDHSLNPAGRFIVTLANGQIWQQLSGDETFAHLQKTSDKILVTIERGILGSFSLHFSDQLGTFKVRRLR